MESILFPKPSNILFEVAGGSYHSWSGSDLPLFKEAKLGAGKLVLKPLCYALPHYADSAKIGYVIKGRGMAGMVDPQDPEEKIVTLETGDFIQVPLGVVSWWSNESESDFMSILFLGDTSEALTPGDITYFNLAGSAGVFTGLSPTFVSKSFKVEEEQAKKLFTSQPEFFIVELQERLTSGLKLCEDSEAEKLKRSANDLFSADVVKLGCDEIWGARYSSGVQVVCVVRGSGRFQIVGSNGKRMLEAEVKEGELFVVPKFVVVSATAGGEGIEWFSITMSPK